MVTIIYTVAIQLKNTIYCKPYEVEKFVVAKLNCNLVENIHGWMVVLYGQRHTGYFTGKFCRYQLIRENCKTFPL